MTPNRYPITYSDGSVADEKFHRTMLAVNTILAVILAVVLAVMVAVTASGV